MNPIQAMNVTHVKRYMNKENMTENDNSGISTSFSQIG